MSLAALFVDPRGVYADRTDVDCWGVERDARLYPGPLPVVAHPPCKRWGRYWSGGPSARVRRIKGDDGGCFAAALHSVRLWGGVLEHPADSHAWWWHGLTAPPRAGGWVQADAHGWACRVEQGFYGHRARKGTWLYAVRCDLPDLRWGEGEVVVDPDASDAWKARAAKDGVNVLLSKKQRAATPPPFAELLLAMARSVRPDADPWTLDLPLTP